MPKVSIIVPVYNGEKTLERCVDSVLKQEYKDFELFLINDGSSDKTREICERYAAADDRVLVIHKENSGVSESRNMAIAQIRLFRRMLDRRHFLRYRKSGLRKYAKHFRELGYEPKTYNEKVLCKKLVFFGYTGISYSGVDARQLR